MRFCHEPLAREIGQPLPTSTTLNKVTFNTWKNGSQLEKGVTLEKTIILGKMLQTTDCKADTTCETFRDTNMTRTDIVGSQQWTAVFALLGARHHCVAKICNAGVTYLRYTAKAVSLNINTKTQTRSLVP